MYGENDKIEYSQRISSVRIQLELGRGCYPNTKLATADEAEVLAHVRYRLLCGHIMQSNTAM